MSDDTLRKAFMVLTRVADQEVDLLARRLVESDARTMQPWLVTARPIIDRQPHLCEIDGVHQHTFSGTHADVSHLQGKQI